eukprot:7903998-Alexandrium_andersonii.AAC.1
MRGTTQAKDGSITHVGWEYFDHLYHILEPIEMSSHIAGLPMLRARIFIVLVRLDMAARPKTRNIIENTIDLKANPVP